MTERKRESRRRVGPKQVSTWHGQKFAGWRRGDRCDLSNGSVVRECDIGSVASSLRRFFFFFFLGYSVRKCRPDVSPRGKEHADYSGIREERNFATRRARGGGEGGGEKGGRLHERTRGDAINWYCFIGYQRKPREGRQRICASPGESASVVSALFRLCVHICIHRCKHAAETRRRRSDGNRSSSAIGPRGYRERHVSYAGIVNWGSRWFGFSPGRSRI